MVDIKNFVTIRQASKLTGLPVWKLQRAAKAGHLKTFTFFDSRRLVRVEDVSALIKAVGAGGAQ